MSLLRGLGRLQAHSSSTILPAIAVSFRGTLATPLTRPAALHHRTPPPPPPPPLLLPPVGVSMMMRRLAHTGPTQTVIADHNEVPDQGGATTSKILSRPRIDMFKGSTKMTLREMVDALPTKLDMRSKVVFTNWLNDQDNDCPHLYATGENKELIGFACLHSMDTSMFAHHSHPYAVDLVYVVPSMRRQGLAADLLKECTKHYQITSFCRDEESASLHRKAGFQQQGIIPKLIVMSAP